MSNGDNSATWSKIMDKLSLNAEQERYNILQGNEDVFDRNILQLTYNMLNLNQKTVQDIIVPRSDVIAIDSKSSFEMVRDTIVAHGYSRYPIYEETLDNSIGLLHIKDLIAIKDTKNFNPLSLMKTILFVSPYMLITELLLEMRIKRVHMALIIDEYGGVDGLVTIEDLIEEIVGDIADEHDEPDETFILEKSSGIEISGRTPITTLEEVIGEFATDEEKEEFETIAGLMIGVKGRVPVRGEIIKHSSGKEFSILEGDSRRVHKIFHVIS